MQQYQLTVITSIDEDFQRITVQRSHFFLDALHAFSKSSLNVLKLLKVVLLANCPLIEGPTFNEGSLYRIRHICRVARQCCTNSRCRGCGCQQVLHCSKMMSKSLVQGGQPPVCFAKGVAEYLVFDGIRCDPSLNDIFDPSVRHMLEKVSQRLNLTSLSSATYLNFL